MIFISANLSSSAYDFRLERYRGTASEYEYDEAGNLKVVKSIFYGEVDSNGDDVDPSDNHTRYSYTHYVDNWERWILDKPYLTYSSLSDSCGTQTSSLSACQFMRQEFMYDYKGFNVAPDVGLLTRKRVIYRDKDEKEKVYEEQYEYDSYGNLIRVRQPKPNIETVTSDNDLIITKENIYDDYYHSLLVETQNALGQKTKYDKNDYDYLLQVPRLIRKQINRSPERYLVSRLEFDGLGRLRKVYPNDPTSSSDEGDILKDSQGRDVPGVVTYYFEPGTISEFSGLVVRQMNLVSKDSAGNYTYTTVDKFYNGLGMVIEEQVLKSKVNGEDKRIVMVNDFNANGQITTNYVPQLTNPLTVESPPHISDNLPDFITYQRSEDNNELISQITETVEYDNLGRVTKSVRYDEDGRSYETKYFYAANGKAVITPEGSEKVSIVDNVGRVKEEVMTGRFGKQIVKKYNYKDKQGEETLVDKPTRIELFSGADSDCGSGECAISEYEYDDNGKLRVSIDPSLGRYEYKYDILGNKTEVRKLDVNQTITFHYDKVGRIEYKLYSPSLYDYRPASSYYDNFIIYYSYDDRDNALGKITEVRDPTGETVYYYDRGQRLYMKGKEIFGDKVGVLYGYNEISQLLGEYYVDFIDSAVDLENLLSIGDNSQDTGEYLQVVSYTYDEENRIQNIKDGVLSSYQLLEGTEFDRNGNLINAQFSFNGTGRYLQSTSYDSKIGRLVNLEIKRRNTGVNIFQQVLNYNNYGEIESIEHLGGTDQFYYDEFSNLTFARIITDTGVKNSSYAYDVFGRIVTKNEDKSITFTYDNRSNSNRPFFAPKSVNVDNTDINLVYTPLGNLTEWGGEEYTYNTADKLIEIKKEGVGTYRFYYDFDGNLVFIDRPDRDTTIFGQLEKEKQADGSYSRKLYIPLTSYVTVVEKDYNERYFLIKDYLNSTRGIIDSRKPYIFDTNYYFPYGNLMTSISETSITDRFFTGQRKIDDLTIYHFGARFYNPTLGIFIQSDKVVGPNRYAYANNNPIHFNDPSGNDSNDTRYFPEGYNPRWWEKVLLFIFEPFLDNASIAYAPDSHMGEGYVAPGDLVPATEDPLSPCYGGDPICNLPPSDRTGDVLFDLFTGAVAGGGAVGIQKVRRTLADDAVEYGSTLIDDLMPARPIVTTSGDSFTFIIYKKRGGRGAIHLRNTVSPREVEGGIEAIQNIYRSNLDELANLVEAGELQGIDYFTIETGLWPRSNPDFYTQLGFTEFPLGRTQEKVLSFFQNLERLIKGANLLSKPTRGWYITREKLLERPWRNK